MPRPASTAVDDYHPVVSDPLTTGQVLVAVGNRRYAHEVSFTDFLEKFCDHFIKMIAAYLNAVAVADGFYAQLDRFFGVNLQAHQPLGDQAFGRLVVHRK